MKFKDLPYERPDIDAFDREADSLAEAFEAAQSAQEQIRITYSFFKLQDHFHTLTTLSSIRNGADVTDEYCEKEYEYCSEISPIFYEHCNKFLKAFVSSRFRPQLEEEFGAHLFELYNASISTFDEALIPYIQEENRLCQKYDKLMASAQVEFNGEKKTLSQMGPYMSDKDRAVRKAANEAYFKFFSDHMEEIDDIYDQLVKLRAKMAEVLHAKSYIDVAYPMLCKDYTPEEAQRFRDGVCRCIVPMAGRFKELQKEILGLPDLKYYDLSLHFKNGNAKPMKDLQKQLECAKKMYDELSPETSEYFRTVLDQELYDLEERPNKYTGAYCTWIPDYRLPYIYSVNNGTQGDVNTLTHEAGHGFQVYETMKNNIIPDYMFPAYDACEIMSMGMEFITWPWMHLFFGEDALKYKYYLVSEDMVFIPYSCCVDEFQHEVYAHPELTPKERRALWRQLEKKYMPYTDYDGNEFLESGGYWFVQSHIFSTPFYYLDYALAQIGAYQYWMKTEADREQGWQDYLGLCRAGGREGLHKLLKIGKLKDPFQYETLEEICAYVDTWVKGIDISQVDRPHEA